MLYNVYSPQITCVSTSTTLVLWLFMMKNLIKKLNVYEQISMYPVLMLPKGLLTIE